MAYSIAPGLMEGFESSLAVPEIAAMGPPADPIGPPPVIPGGQSEGVAGTIIDALIKAAGSGLVKAGGGNPMQAQAAAVEKQRKQRAGQQLQAYTTYLGQAFATGDAKIITNAIQQVSRIKDIEPEVATAISELPLKLGEQIGKTAKIQQALAMLPQDPSNKKMTVLRDLIAKGVDLDTAKLLVSSMPTEKAPEPFTLRPGEQRFLPNSQGGFNVMQGPEGKAVDTMTPTTMADLEMSGVRLGGRTTVNQISPTEWAQLEKSKRQARLDDKRMALEFAAGIRANEKRDAPINEKNQYYIDPKTLQHPYPDMSREELGKHVREKRLVAIRPTDAANLRDMRATAMTLVDMRNVAKRLLTQNPGMNLAQAVKLAAQRGLASSADAALFAGWSGAMSVKLAADFNRGRPSDKDQLAIKGLIFNERDTVKTALAKIDGVIKHYNNKSVTEIGVPILDPADYMAGPPMLPGASKTMNKLEGKGW